MKILYVITSLSVGGAEKALADLALYFKQKHRVKVVCLNPIGDVGIALQKEGVEIHALNASKIPTLKQVNKLREIIKKFQPDLVHAMLFRAVELCRALHISQKFKLVSTLHFDLAQKNWWLRALDRVLSKQDLLTVAESLSTGKYLVEVQKYPKNRVYLLPNSVNRCKFVKNEKNREKIREILHVKPDTTVFVCLARLSKEKNHLLLLESFRDLIKKTRKAHLLLVGDGAERNSLEAFCDLNGLKKFVTFAGAQKEAADYLNAADVFVLTSKTESLPIALLEAISVGLPGIVTKVGDMPAVILHGKNGFVLPSEDSILLSCFMQELADNLDLRRQMGEASLEAASIRALDSGPEHEKVYNTLLK